MFKPTIESATGLYSLEKARSLAEGLQAADCEGWSYRVVDALNGLGRIDVYDEEGQLVIKGMLL